MPGRNLNLGTSLLPASAGGTGRADGTFTAQYPRPSRGFLDLSRATAPGCDALKNLAAEAEGYVTGIEPSTGFPYTRRLERAAGRVPKLAPNATRHFTIEVAIHTDRASVTAAEQRFQNN
jgi:hypothetical protein